MNETIEFEVIDKKNKDVTLKGYIYKEDINDDNPDIYYYNNLGLEVGSYIPSNPFEENSKEWEAYNDLITAFQTDFLFIQYLSDYADEDKTVPRDGYILKINNGE